MQSKVSGRLLHCTELEMTQTSSDGFSGPYILFFITKWSGEKVSRSSVSLLEVNLRIYGEKCRTFLGLKRVSGPD